MCETGHQYRVSDRSSVEVADALVRGDEETGETAGSYHVAYFAGDIFTVGGGEVVVGYGGWFRGGDERAKEGFHWVTGGFDVF